MGGFDDHVAVIEDWVPPSPSPRAFFSAGWGDDDSSSRSISNHPAENRNGAFFPGRDEQIVSGKTDEKDWERIGGAGDQFTKSNPFIEQEMSSRGGLFERRAARTGFNAPRLNTESIRPADLSLNPDVRSPYLTIPPGLSPTTLLESPVFLSNLPVQPSPTTGKFSFAPGGNTRSSTLITEPLKGSKNFPEDINASSFTFKPVAASDPSLFSGAASKRTPSTLPQQTFPTFDVSVQSENSLQSQSALPAKILSQNGATLHCQADFSIPSDEKDAGGSNTVMSDSRVFGNFVGSADRSPPPDEQQDEETDQRGVGDTTVGGAQAEDGYNWRKYGQKQVKGSEYPRSYYKCTHPNCPVKKKVERSPEGHVTEIIYKGAHNHPKPPLNRRSVMGYPNLTTDIQVEISDQTGTQIGADDEPSWTTVQKGTADCNGPNYLQGKNGTHGELGDAIDVSSTFSNEEEEDDQGTYGSESLGYDGNGYESDSKRRKMECYATEMGGATRAIREPRVVVQTTSDVDILDDGYRWRKYGQKVVKGNPNPRSYYKCTSVGCTVRKHVERASHDLKSVITTYEGKHNHDVPVARNSSHVHSGTPGNVPGAAQGGGAVIPSHLHRPEPTQIYNLARFERSPAPSAFGQPGRQQLGPPRGFAFGMNQADLANLAMVGLAHNQGKLPVLPVVHSYLGQQRPVNEMGFMLPKEEPKAEPLSETPQNLPNGSSVYSQIMSRLPLEPHM